MPLVKWSQSHVREPVFSVISNGFNPFVAYTHPFVRVPEGYAERQLIVEREIELRERGGLGDVKLHLSWKEYKPDDEDRNTEDKSGSNVEEPQDEN